MTSSILDEFSADELAYALRSRGYVVLRQQDVRVVSVSSCAYLSPVQNSYGSFVKYVKDELGTNLGRLLVAEGAVGFSEYSPQTDPWSRRFDATIEVVVGRAVGEDGT